jgi:hypothetical protein
MQPGDHPTAVLDLDPSLARRLTRGTVGIAMNPDRDLAWVLRTLIPPDLRHEYGAKIKEVWIAKRSEILEALGPPSLQLVQELAIILKESFGEALAAHSTEKDEFFAVLREDIYAKRLAPILEEQVVRRLEAKLTPLAAELGQEIWDSVGVGDLMAVSWIATKDLVGAAKKNEMSAKLAEVLQRSALPVIKRKAPHILQEALKASEEGLRSEASQIAVMEAMHELTSHPAFVKFVQGFLTTWILENPKIHARIKEALNADEFREPLDQLWKALEPTLEAGLEEVLTRPDRQGMDHQLVRVLRLLVLKKDIRYLLLLPGPEDAERIQDKDLIKGSLGRDT